MSETDSIQMMRDTVACYHETRNVKVGLAITLLESLLAKYDALQAERDALLNTYLDHKAIRDDVARENAELQQTIAGLESDMMDARETISQLKQEYQRLRDCLMGAKNTTFTESKR